MIWYMGGGSEMDYQIKLALVEYNCLTKGRLNISYLDIGV